MSLWGQAISPKKPVEVEFPDGLDLTQATLAKGNSAVLFLTLLPLGLHEHGACGDECDKDEDDDIEEGKETTFAIARLSAAAPNCKLQLALDRAVRLSVVSNDATAEVHVLGNISLSRNYNSYEDSDDENEGMMPFGTFSPDGDSDDSDDKDDSDDDDDDGVELLGSDDDEEEVDHFKSGKIVDITDSTEQSSAAGRSTSVSGSATPASPISGSSGGESTPNKASASPKKKAVGKSITVPSAVSSKLSFGAQVAQKLAENKSAQAVSPSTSTTGEADASKKRPREDAAPSLTTLGLKKAAKVAKTNTQGSPASSTSNAAATTVPAGGKGAQKQAKQKAQADLANKGAKQQQAPAVAGKSGEKSTVAGGKEKTATNAKPLASATGKTQAVAGGKGKNETLPSPALKRELPGGVKTEVLVTGDGPSVASVGRKVRVKYEGRLASTGAKFDNGTLEFTVGAREMIEGFDVGVRGMLTKEKRRVFIPSKLGYGPKKMPGIPANSNLIFDVQLLSVK